jgi:hypothetical protein
MMQRPILKYFAMTNILGYEPLADETINAFIQKLDRRFADTGEVCDMDDWLFYCERPGHGVHDGILRRID